MTNPDTSQKEPASGPNYDWANRLRQSLLDEYLKMRSEFDQKGQWYPKTRKLIGTAQTFDKEKLTITLKPKSYMALLHILTLAAAFRQLQARTKDLTDEQRKQLDQMFGISSYQLTGCNAANCEMQANVLARFLNHTLHPYEILQNHKWDTDPIFNAFMDVCRLAAAGRMAEDAEKEREKNDSAGTTSKED